MPEALAFCRAVMHEYERQWSQATGHGVRHPLRLKMDRLQAWCDDGCSTPDFEARLRDAQRSDDPGAALLAGELLPLWQAMAAGEEGPPPISH